MNTLGKLLWAVCTLGLAGCYPVERFWWSPDGTQAVVVAGEPPRLHFAAAGGELSAPLASVQFVDDLPLGVSWLPDGRGFVLHRTLARATWEEARALLPADEAKDIERRAAGIPNLLLAAAAMAGDAEPTELSAFFPSDKLVMTAAFFCAREKQKAAVEAAVLANTYGAQILAQVEQEKTPFHVHEICLISAVADQAEREPQSITRSIHPILLPKVSPKFPVVAYWRILQEDKNVALEVATLDGTSRIFAGQSSSATFDWTADGRSVVCAVPVAESDKLVQTIRRATVLEASGALEQETQESQDLAVAIMPNPARLCVLPDDRVLFASQPVKLPAASGALDLEPRLYVISADGKAVSEVPTAPGDLPANLSFFVPSPDGQRVAVVESDTVAVAVVELATGKTEIVSPAREGWGSRTVPAWRSATELTFAGIDDARRARWMSWKQGQGVRPLDEKWPPTATRGWLSEKKDSRTPANETP